jgi:DNA topoisomerase-2
MKKGSAKEKEQTSVANNTFPEDQLTQERKDELAKVFQSYTPTQIIAKRPAIMLGSNIPTVHSLYTVRRVDPAIQVKKEQHQDDDAEIEAEDADEKEKEPEPEEKETDVEMPALEDPKAAQNKTKSKTKAPIPFRLVHESAEFPPALKTVFYEPVSNIYDHFQRKDKKCTSAEIRFDKKEGVVLYRNNGIPPDCVRIENAADKSMVWVPQNIFFKLFSGSNFSDTVRLGGGQNGVGIVLCSCVANWFELEIGDPVHHVLYKQTSRRHLDHLDQPVVTPYHKATGYVQVRFQPDWDLFRSWGMTDAFFPLLDRLLHTWCFDLGKSCMSVKYNGEKIPVKNWTTFCQMLPAQSMVVERLLPTFRVAIGLLPADAPEDAARQRSSVNGIHTTQGGTHVTFVENAIVDAVMSKYKYKDKDKFKEKDAKAKKKGEHVPRVHMTRRMITDKLFLAVDCVLPNPAFESQSKQQLMNKVSEWTPEFTPAFSDAFVRRVLKRTNIAELARQDVEDLKQRKFDKMAGSQRRSTMRVEKLEDAADAGTKAWRDCTLFLTEGDSAAALIRIGREALPPEKKRLVGFFPLKGKPISVLSASVDQKIRNTEYCSLVQILGLSKDVSLDGKPHPRYGRVALFTDADDDGTHIRGLLLEMFQHEWPQLFAAPGFLIYIRTPVTRARNAKGEVKSFYSESSYYAWYNALEEKAKAQWTAEHLKGLGSLTGDDALEIFSDLDKYICEYHYSGSECDEAVAFSFDTKRAAERRALLSQRPPDSFRDLSSNAIMSPGDFLRESLPVFWHRSNARAIPRMEDGLKPAQRKLMYMLFKSKRISERQAIKSAALAGVVIEKACYAHGEASLTEAIAKLAADHACALNMPLMYPKGIFGTRNMLGDDHASPRYTNVFLSPLTRAMFPEADAPVLTRVVTEGQVVEPVTYCPVLPIVLINGASGIGTGFRTEFPGLAPEVVGARVMAWIDLQERACKEREGKEKDKKNEKENENENPRLPETVYTPFIRGFRGTIEPKVKKAARRTKKENAATSSASASSLDQKIEYVKKTWVARGVATYDPKAKKIVITEIPPGARYDDWRTSTLYKFMDEKEHRRLTPASFMTTGNGSLRVEAFLTDEGVAAWVPAGALKEEFWMDWKLTETLSINDLVLFTPQGTLRKYDSYDEVLHEWCPLRWQTYIKRAGHGRAVVERDCLRLRNKIRFLNCIQDRTIDFTSRPSQRVLSQRLSELKFDMDTEMDMDMETELDKEDGEMKQQQQQQQQQQKKEKESDKDLMAGYKYLTKLSISSLTVEDKAKLEAQLAAKEADVMQWKAWQQNPGPLWRQEIKHVLEQWAVFLVDTERRSAGIRVKGKGKGNGAEDGKGKGKKRTVVKSATRGKKTAATATRGRRKKEDA